MVIIKAQSLLRFPEITFGFSTKIGGDRNAPYFFNMSKSVNDSEQIVDENRKQFFENLGLSMSQVVFQKQEHTDIITYVDKPGQIGISDALITDKPNLGLAISSADCTPIFLYDYKNHVIAGIHSGWRGTELRILEKTLVRLHNDFNTLPEDIMAYIGPSISQNAYEVGPEFITKFHAKYLKPSGNKFLLDVAGINYDILTGYGLNKNNIQLSSLCSYNTGILHSYRRDGAASGRAFGVIALKGKMSKENLKITAAYILICLIWGSTWMAIRIGLDYLTPFVSSGIRFITASIAIWLLMKYKKIELQKDQTSIVLYLILVIFSFVLPFGLVYWGQQYVPSGLASVIFGVYPFFVAIFSYFALPDEKISIPQIIAMVLGFAGIVVIFSDVFLGGINFNLLGMIAVFICGLLQAGIAVTIKKYGKHLNSLSMNFPPMLISGIILLLFGLVVEDTSKLDFNFAAVTSILFLAVFGSVVTFTAYYWMLKRISVVLLALTAFITPVVAVIMGFLFLNEKLAGKHLLGSSLVLCGILFANLGNRIFLFFRNLVSVKTSN